MLDKILTQEMMLLAVAALMLYAASRAASEAMAVRGHALGRAIGHSLPIGMVGVAAIWARLDSLAVGVIYSASVMCLTLVAGVALLSAPLDDPIEGRHSWGLVLPIGVLGVIAGLTGGITLQLGLGLLVLGGVIIWSWRGDAGVPMARLVTPGHSPAPGRVVMVILAIIIAGMAAVAVTWAVASIGSTNRVLSIGTLAGTVIAPLTVLPLVGSSSERAYRERSSASSMSAAIATAILCVTVWLPIIAVLRIWRDYADGTLMTASLPIPLGVWRVDAILLTAVGTMLVPIGLRRWQPGRIEGGVLVALYVVFVALMAMSGWR